MMRQVPPTSRPIGAMAEGDSVQHHARRFHAADVGAHRGRHDAEVHARNDERIRCTHALAEVPAACASDVALKLAAVIRAKMADTPRLFDEVEQAEFLLLTSALIDLVLVADA